MKLQNRRGEKTKKEKKKACEEAKNTRTTTRSSRYHEPEPRSEEPFAFAHSRRHIRFQFIAKWRKQIRMKKRVMAVPKRKRKRAKRRGWKRHGIIRGFLNDDEGVRRDAEPFLPKILLRFVSKVADAGPHDQNPRQISCVQNPRLRPKTAKNGRTFCENTSISVHRRTQRRNLMMPILFMFM